jgi:hypothetical protein
MLDELLQLACMQLHKYIKKIFGNGEKTDFIPLNFHPFHVVQPVGPVGTLAVINTAIGNCPQTETDVVTKI